jgi:hypothetical protein
VRRWFWILAGIVLLFGTAVVLYGGWRWYRHAESIRVTFPAPTFRAVRATYPYSVVPGGVYSPQEVADSVAHDPVARKHYDGIETDRLWVTTARQPMLAYVSYRYRDAVAWTTHPITIAKGETLLTDGENFIRARCGNRLVEFKKPRPLPATADVVPPPPPDIVFDTPLPSFAPPTIRQPAPPIESVLAKEVSPTHWRDPLWCCTDEGAVPEPGTLFLVGSGIAALAASRRRKRR